MSTILSKLFGGRARKASNPAPRATVKPRLEALEDRTALSTVALAADGTTYAIWGSDRGLWHRDLNGHWSEVFNANTWQYVTNVQQVAAGSDGSIDYAQSPGPGCGAVIYQAKPAWYNNYLWIPKEMVNQFTVAPTVSALAAGQNGEIYAVWQFWKAGTLRQVLEEYRWAGDLGLELDRNVADVSVGGFGQLYVVHADGSLYSADAAYDSWSINLLLSGGVHHVAGGTGWNYYITYGSNNQLWEQDSNGYWYDHFDGPNGSQWFYNVAQISADGNGGVDFVTTDSYLYHTGNGYQSLDSIPWFATS
jgi:hypothetical protein